jgi:hypothetical protein
VSDKERGDKPFGSAKAKRPCVEMDMAGASLNQSALNMLVEMLKNSFAEPYDLVDIHIKKVSRAVIPNLTACLPDRTREEG